MRVKLIIEKDQKYARILENIKTPLWNCLQDMPEDTVVYVDTGTLTHPEFVDLLQYFKEKGLIVRLDVKSEYYEQNSKSLTELLEDKYCTSIFVDNTDIQIDLTLDLVNGTYCCKENWYKLKKLSFTEIMKKMSKTQKWEQWEKNIKNIDVEKIYGPLYQQGYLEGCKDTVEYWKKEINPNE